MERLLSLVKRALIANSVFFKTLSKSIYTSNMIKGGRQGGLKRKITDPKYLWKIVGGVSSNFGAVTFCTAADDFLLSCFVFAPL